MKPFDFADHLRKKKSAATFIDKLMLEREFFTHYDALPKKEQRAFKQELDDFLGRETNRLVGELEQLEKTLPS